MHISMSTCFHVNTMNQTKQKINFVIYNASIFFITRVEDLKRKNNKKKLITKNKYLQLFSVLIINCNYYAEKIFKKA